MGDTNSGARPSDQDLPASPPESASGLSPSGNDPSRTDLLGAAIALRTAEKAYMADRENEALGQAVGRAARLLDCAIEGTGMTGFTRHFVVAEILDCQEKENASRPEFEPAISREMVEQSVNALLGIYDCRSSDTAAAYAWMGLWQSLGIDWWNSKITRLPASGIDARSDETLQASQPVGREPVPSGDAQPANPPTKGR
jgi:hypothetical protein